MLCPNCNQEINENATFCSNCGARLNNEKNQYTNISIETPIQQAVSVDTNVASFIEQEKNNVSNPCLQQTNMQSVECQTSVSNENTQCQQPFVANFNNQNVQPMSMSSGTNVNTSTQPNFYSDNINTMQQNISQSNPYQFQPNNQVEDKKDKKTILIIVGVVAALLLVCCCCLPAIGIAFSLNA